jgi:predicted oxidoreductase
MHPESIAATFESLKKAGKVLHFGISNFSTSQFEMLNSFFPLESHQIEASIFHLQPFEDGQIDQLFTKHIQPTAWSPLGGGLNTLEQSPEKLILVINNLCKKYDINTGQLLLAWLLKHPARIIPVLGTSKTSRIKDAMAIQNLSIDSEDWYALYSASKGTPLP